MDLSGYERKKIKKALISAYPTRDKLIVMLYEEIDIDESKVHPNGDYDTVVFYLIRDFDSQGSIDKLIDGARSGNRGNYRLQKLSTTLKAFKILAPLKEEYIEQMKQAYVDYCPEDWQIIKNFKTGHELEQILDDLEDMPQGSNPNTRTEQFVARLLREARNRLPPEKLDKLKELGKEYFNNFDKLLTQKDETLTIERTQNIPNHLIVLLMPSKQHKKRYFVSAWFIPDGRNGKFNHQTGKGYKILENREYEQETFTLEQIPCLLEDYLDQMTRYQNDLSPQATFSPRATIEVFLPYELLNEPIDTWIIKQEKGLPIPIGIRYKVIVRSSNRFNKYHYRNVWVEKWETLKELTENRCYECCTSGDDHSWQELFSKLNQESIIGLKLVKPPSKEIFQVMNKMAIPVALWLRQELENLNHQVELDELLTCSITELPERVRQKRLYDFPDDYEQRIGHHLSLLWENPYILPPQIEYTTPS